MDAWDRTYYARRAEAELALARSAGHPAAMRAHYHLAGYYLDRIYGSHAERVSQPDGLTHLIAGVRAA